ncbi:MAG TPA: type II secretion system F family protein [Bryobacteraceae bacterium]|nr:type II secretion system F family protein [Bryobacteraceae bacterium]
MLPPVVIPLILFTALMAGISFYGYRRYARSARVLRQLEEPSFAASAAVPGEAPSGEPRVVVKVLQQVGGALPVSPADTKTVRRDLVRAGYRSDQAVAVIYGIKVISTVLLLFLTLLLRERLTDNPVLRIVLVVAGAAAGFVLPNILLEKRVAARQERLRLSLPDALDLMVVSVEAGLGLDQAMMYVTRELMPTHREISEELGLVNLEMRAGKRRAEALRNLADRTGEEEIRKLVAILIQNDRFGTSMAESLRTHSDFMRTRRRQEAEERAAKVGVKLVFPIFFFILPSMMLVTAGPGLLQIFKNLFPMMRQIH